MTAVADEANGKHYGLCLQGRNVRYVHLPKSMDPAAAVREHVRVLQIKFLLFN